jgi:hypothetical protein
LVSSRSHTASARSQTHHNMVASRLGSWGNDSNASLLCILMMIQPSANEAAFIWGGGAAAALRFGRLPHPTHTTTLGSLRTGSHEEKKGFARQEVSFQEPGKHLQQETNPAASPQSRGSTPRTTRTPGSCPGPGRREPARDESTQSFIPGDESTHSFIPGSRRKTRQHEDNIESLRGMLCQPEHRTPGPGGAVQENHERPDRKRGVDYQSLRLSQGMEAAAWDNRNPPQRPNRDAKEAAALEECRSSSEGWRRWERRSTPTLTALPCSQPAPHAPARQEPSSTMTHPSPENEGKAKDGLTGMPIGDSSTLTHRYDAATRVDSSSATLCEDQAHMKQQAETYSAIQAGRAKEQVEPVGVRSRLTGLQHEPMAPPAIYSKKGGQLEALIIATEDKGLRGK